MACVIKDDGNFYPKLFLEKTFVSKQNFNKPR